MQYDLEMIERRVSEKRRRFLRRLGVCAGLIAISLTVMLLNFNVSATFIGGAVIFACLIWIANTLITIPPSVLFSPAIEGVNVKEHEYLARQSQGGLLKGTPRIPNLPYTYANRKTSTPRHLIRGTVFIRLENGDVTSWSGLFPKHMDVYEEGDLLYKPAGARFFFVKSREVKEQPCPLCGAVNTKERSECEGCGLLIVKNRAQ